MNLCTVKEIGIKQDAYLLTRPMPSHKINHQTGGDWQKTVREIEVLNTSPAPRPVNHFKMSSLKNMNVDLVEFAGIKVTARTYQNPKDW